jgi:hypothetical protein
MKFDDIPGWVPLGPLAAALYYLWRYELKPVILDLAAAWDRHTRLHGLALIVLREQQRGKDDETARQLGEVVKEATDAQLARK